MYVFYNFLADVVNAHV